MPCLLTPTPAHGPSNRLRLQALRLALLDWVCHVVVANGALVQTVLQTLVYSLLPPPGPPLPDPNPGEAWVPQPAQAAIQDEVVAAAEKVGHGAGHHGRHEMRERQAGQGAVLKIRPWAHPSPTLPGYTDVCALEPLH